MEKGILWLHVDLFDFLFSLRSNGDLSMYSEFSVVHLLCLPAAEDLSQI